MGSWGSQTWHNSSMWAAYINSSLGFIHHTIHYGGRETRRKVGVLYERRPVSVCSSVLWDRCNGNQPVKARWRMLKNTSLSIVDKYVLQEPRNTRATRQVPKRTERKAAELLIFSLKEGCLCSLRIHLTTACPSRSRFFALGSHWDCHIVGSTF